MNWDINPLLYSMHTDDEHCISMHIYMCIMYTFTEASPFGTRQNGIECRSSILRFSWRVNMLIRSYIIKSLLKSVECWVSLKIKIGTRDCSSWRNLICSHMDTKYLLWRAHLHVRRGVSVWFVISFMRNVNQIKSSHILFMHEYEWITIL